MNEIMEKVFKKMEDMPKEEFDALLERQKSSALYQQLEELREFGEFVEGSQGTK